MDSPRVAPPLRHGIDRHLPHGQPPPDPTPAASRIHQRLAADEKRRWDVDCINDFELMFWCAHENFDFSPPHLPSTTNHPTPTSHPIRPQYPLEYIVDEGKRKYEGEKSPASLLAGYFSITHLLFLSFASHRGHASKCPTDTNYTPPDPSIPSNSSTTRGRWNMEAICWGEVSRQGKSWSEELLSSLFCFLASHLRLVIVAVV
jgi:hypothetical protein